MTVIWRARCEKLYGIQFGPLYRKYVFFCIINACFYIFFLVFCIKIGGGAVRCGEVERCAIPAPVGLYFSTFLMFYFASIRLVGVVKVIHPLIF